MEGRLVEGSRKDSWADQLRGFDYLTFAFMVLPSVQDRFSDLAALYGLSFCSCFLQSSQRKLPFYDYSLCSSVMIPLFPFLSVVLFLSHKKKQFFLRTIKAGLPALWFY